MKELMRNNSFLMLLIHDITANIVSFSNIFQKNAFIWKIVLFIIIGSLLFLVLPPFVFTSLENWTYIEGIYYSFATISAIGLGDYTIGES